MSSPRKMFFGTNKAHSVSDGDMLNTLIKAYCFKKQHEIPEHACDSRSLVYDIQPTLAMRTSRCHRQKLHPRPKLQRNVWKQLPLLRDSHNVEDSIADTSCGPKQAFLLFYSCYNGQLGHIE